MVDVEEWRGSPALREMGHVRGADGAQAVEGQWVSLQANKKTREGFEHPTATLSPAHLRDRQRGACALRAVISVDAKKRELVGDFQAVGRKFEPKGQPVEVRGDDFKDKRLGTRSPTASSLATDEGWVSVGVTSHTARSRSARSSTGGSSSARSATRRADADDHRRFRRVELPGPACGVTKCNASPTRPGCGSVSATSRQDLEVKQDRASDVQLREPHWRGKPLESVEIIVNLIAVTTTTTGLKIYACLDDKPTNAASTWLDEQLAAVNITRHTFHGDWNYTVIPSHAQS